MKAQRFLSVAAAALLPIALLTGCSSDNSSEAPSTAATTASATSEATEAPDAGTRVVVDQYSNDIEIPAKLKAFMQGEKQSVGMEKDFETFKSYLLAQ